MPITKRQFELGIDEDIQSWMQKIYARLSTNRELAYSAEEVQEGLLHDTRQVQTLEKAGTMHKIYRALDVLVEIGAVDKRSVADTGYFAFGSEFDHNSWLPTKS